MKNKKKITLVGIIIALLPCTLLLSGCGKDEFLNNKKDNTSSVKKYQVALITKSTNSAFWKSVYSGANAASAEYNLNLIFEGPENEEDYETQNTMIDQAVSDGADAIVFSAVDYMANAEAINRAANKGVKIIVIDSDVNSSLVSCRIGTDNYEAGCTAGKAALECGSPVLHIGIVNFDKNSENGQTREKGFRDTVAKDERAEIVASINVLSSTEIAKEETMKMLAAHPEINIVVTFNEWTSLGVGYAIRELDMADTTTVVAFDSNVVSVGMLELGEVDALVVQNPYAMGYLGMESAYQLLNGFSLDSEEVNTSTMLVTRENMYNEECQRAIFAFDKEN